MKLRRIWQLLLAFLVITLVAVGGLSVGLFYTGRDFFASQWARMMLGSAKSVAKWASVNMSADDWSGTAHSRERIPWMTTMSSSRLWLVNREGLVLADTREQSGWEGARVSDPVLDQVFSGKLVAYARTASWFPGAVVVGAPVMAGDQVVGAALMFAMPDRLDFLMEPFVPLVLQTAAAALIISMLAAYLLTGPLDRPVEQISAYVRRIGRRQFDGPEPRTSIVEFQEIASILKASAMELRDAFATLTKQKRRVQMLLQSMGEGVIATDEHGLITSFNPAAVRILGVERSVGTQAEQAGLPEPLATALRQAAEGGANKSFKAVFASGGKEIRAVVSLAIGADGEATGAVAVLEDVTAETRLRRAQEIFVSSVSHELRTPLASLSAGVEAMHDGLIPESDRQRYMALMLQEIGRLRRLTDDLLEFSLLDSGAVHLTKEEFDVAQVAQEAVETFTPRARAHGVTVVAEAPAVRVISHRDSVMAVLANLLDNAIRYTPDGGSIRVSVQPQQEKVRISVRDTGVGIDPEKLPHIWDPFYKGDVSRTRIGTEGTGLGLPIVRSLVEQMGGEVEVESGPGEGTTFSFTLLSA